MVVLFRSSLRISAAAVRSEVGSGAVNELYNVEEFDLPLILTLCDGYLLFIKFYFPDLAAGYGPRLGVSSAISVNYLRQILCPCESSNESRFRVSSSSEKSWCFGHQYLNVFRVEDCVEK